jgi:hypothetical protein
MILQGTDGCQLIALLFSLRVRVFRPNHKIMSHRAICLKIAWSAECGLGHTIVIARNTITI